MKMLQKLSVMLLLCVMTTMTYAAASSPVALLQSLSDQMIGQLKAKKLILKDHPDAVHAMVRKILLPHVDMNILSRAVLGNAWKQATPAQRQEFQNRFTTILINTYSSALAAYTNETIKFMPTQGDYNSQRTIRVDSRIIRRDGPPIPVSYRLLKRDNDWKVYDLIVEGVSLAQSYRSQFQAILHSGNMNTLLSKMASHNASR